MGSLICYIFPALMYISVMSMSKNTSKTVAQVVLFLGCTILLASTYVTLNSQPTSQKPLDVIPPPHPYHHRENDYSEILNYFIQSYS